MNYNKLTNSRLLRLRNKYRELLYTSHNGGAGGVKDSERFIEIASKLTEINNILKDRSKS